MQTEVNRHLQETTIRKHENPRRSGLTWRMAQTLAEAGRYLPDETPWHNFWEATHAGGDDTYRLPMELDSEIVEGLKRWHESVIQASLSPGERKMLTMTLQHMKVIYDSNLADHSRVGKGAIQFAVTLGDWRGIQVLHEDESIGDLLTFKAFARYVFLQ